MGKRILGEEYSVHTVEKTMVQADLFGNAVETMQAKPSEVKAPEEKPGLAADKNIHNTTAQLFSDRRRRCHKRFGQKIISPKRNLL